MDAVVGEAEEQVGNVSFMLGQLKQGMETIIKTLSEDRSASAQYRTDIRKEIAALRDDYHEVRTDLKTVKEKIEKIEPKVMELEEKDHREQGAKTLAVSVGSFLGKAAQLAIGAIGGGMAVLAEKLLHK